MNKIEKFMSCVVAAVVFVLFFSCPAMASAHRIGNVNLYLFGGLTQVYDDNINLAKDRKSDNATKLSLALKAAHEGKTGSFDFTGGIRHTHYYKNDKLSYTGEDFSLYLDQDFSRYDHFSLSNTFRHTFSPEEFIDEFGRDLGRYESYNNRTDINYKHDFSKQWAGDIGYTHSLTHNTRSDIVSSYSDGIRLATDYSFTTEDILSLIYRYQNRQFRHAGDTDTHTVSANFRHFLTTQLYLDAEAGLNMINTVNNKKTTNPLFTFILTDELNRITSAQLIFTKQNSSTSYSEDVFDYWQTSFVLNRQIFPRLGLYLSGFIGEGKYKPSGTTDDLAGIKTSLAYDLRKNVKLKLTYSFSDKSSNVPSREYRRNYVSLGLNVEF